MLLHRANQHYFIITEKKNRYHNSGKNQSNFFPKQLFSFDYSSLIYLFWKKKKKRIGAFSIYNFIIILFLFFIIYSKCGAALAL